MKRVILLLLLLIICQLSFTQTSYKYVIIPSTFPEIGKGINPYGVSGNIQRILNEKEIKSVFDSYENSEDICEALTIVLTKKSSMLRSKLNVELKDCRNQTVWSNEGTGISKEFADGYNEALTDALSNLKALPKRTVSTTVDHSQFKESDLNQTIYKPRNLYFNYTYFIDLIEKEDGIKELKIINGKLLGYDILQNIATLTPSGVDEISYLVKWTTPKGETIHGVANLSGNNLNISLSSEESPVIISLLKY